VDPKLNLEMIYADGPIGSPYLFDLHDRRSSCSLEQTWPRESQPAGLSGHGWRSQPEVFTLDAWGRAALAAKADKRTVVVDPTAGMFSAVPGDVLIAPEGAVLAKTTFRDWLAR
jgi:hypothetical protein